MRIAGYETHPAADAFPMMEAADLKALAEDIKAHGLHNPVVLHVEAGQRRILDGRNRARACEMAGVVPSTEFWAGEGSPTEWVVSQNLHRRQLSASQRAMVAAALVPLFEEEARARMVAGTPSANLRQGDAGKSTAHAAEVANVSPRSVESALKVIREAKPAVVEAVRRGDVAVSAAARDLKPLPKSKASPPPKRSPTYSLLLVMPTDRVGEVTKALRSIGFESISAVGSNDAAMKLAANQRSA